MSFQEFPTPYNIISLSESYWIRWNVPKQKLEPLSLGKGWVWSKSSDLLLAVTHCLTLLLLFISRPKIKDMYDSSCVSAAAAAKSLQSCPTLCDLIDGSPPGSPVPGILQARTLEWVAISFSNAWKWKGKGKSLSCVRLFATPWTAAYQTPPSMGFSRQEYWSGVPSPSPI